MYKAMISAIGLLAAVACDDGASDSGATPDGATACEWVGLGLCYEHTGYAGAEDWCIAIGDESGFTTEFSAGPCPGEETFVCELQGVTLADDVPVTAYYYSDFQSSQFNDDPAASCEYAGGVPG